MTATLTEYETRRLEKIKYNHALLQNLGLDRSKVGGTKRDSTVDGPKPKRRRITKPIVAPTRTSARIASVPSKPVYNEDAAQQVPLGRRMTQRGGKTKPVPIKPDTLETHKPSAYTSEEVDELRRSWTRWSPSANAPDRDANGTLHFSSHPSFTPNKTPGEMLRQGVFGGSYYRPVYSKTLATEIRDDWSDVPADMLEGVDKEKYLYRPDYNPEMNKYGVKGGQTIEEWEAAGWIDYRYDARGWFQWYIRFFQGRRCEDDERQVGRWERCVGPRGRWRRRLLSKYLQNAIRSVADEADDEAEVSPVLHQTCLHWAWELRQDVLDQIWESGL